MENEIKIKADNLRREYMRNWRRNNKERCKKHTMDYWARKAAQQQAEQENGTTE